MWAKIGSALTDKEGNVDITVILGLIAFFAFLYFGYHHYIVLGKDFDPMGFGAGAGGLSAGHGAAKLMSNKGDYGA